MLLLKQIEKEEKALEALNNEEEIEDDKELETEDELEDEADKADDKEAEDADEEETEDEVDDKKATDKVDDKKVKNDNNTNARLRVAEKLRKEAEAALEAERQRKAEQKAEPKKEQEQQNLTVEEELAQLKAREQAREQREQQQQLHSAAINEFNEIEQDFIKETPDYEKASEFMLNNMVKGVMAAYPHATEKQALQHVQKQILAIASNAARNKQNPAAVLYNLAYERYGYDPRNNPKTAIDAKKESLDLKRENLKNVDKNKKRAASSFSNGGQNGSTSVTSEEGANMSAADFSKLSAKEIDALIAEASA